MAWSNEPRLGDALQRLLVLFGAILLVVGDRDTTRYQPVKLLAGGYVRNVTLGLDTHTGQQVGIFITDTLLNPPQPLRQAADSVADPPNRRGRWC
jgi:hypothetical protein